MGSCSTEQQCFSTRCVTDRPADHVKDKDHEKNPGGRPCTICSTTMSTINDKALFRFQAFVKAI